MKNKGEKNERKVLASDPAWKLLWITKNPLPVATLNYITDVILTEKYIGRPCILYEYSI